MVAVLFGFIVITSIAFFIPTLMGNNKQEVNMKRGIRAASITAVVYVVIVGFLANS